jgi:hypothetical protein
MKYSSPPSVSLIPGANGIEKSPDSIPSGLQFYQSRRKISIKQGCFSHCEHHKYLLRADKINIKKQQRCEIFSIFCQSLHKTIMMKAQIHGCPNMNTPMLDINKVSNDGNQHHSKLYRKI